MAPRAGKPPRPTEDWRKNAMESHVRTLFHLLMTLLPFGV